MKTARSPLEQKRAEGLRWILQHLDLTYEDLVKPMDFTKGLVSRYLKGEDAVSSKFIRRLVEVWGVNPQWLDTGKGEPFLVEKTTEQRKADVENLTKGRFKISEEKTDRYAVEPLREERMGFDVKDGANDDERTRAEKETLSWAYDSEEEIVEKINRVLHDKKTTWGKRIARAKLLLDELRRRVSVKE